MSDIAIETSNADIAAAIAAAVVETATVTETPLAPDVAITIDTGAPWGPLPVAAYEHDTHVALLLGPVRIRLADADALADLHQRIGRQLVELAQAREATSTEAAGA